MQICGRSAPRVPSGSQSSQREQVSPGSGSGTGTGCVSPEQRASNRSCCQGVQGDNGRLAVTLVGEAGGDLSQSSF